MHTILVVDDTAVIRETVAKLLRIEGFRAVCASSGKEALEALPSSNVDLVLLDVMMPDMDGLTCLRHLRDEPRFKALPVIMMTALCNEQYERQAQELGAKEYLVKARCSIAQMLDRVRYHLGQMSN